MRAHLSLPALLLLSGCVAEMSVSSGSSEADAADGAAASEIMDAAAVEEDTGRPSADAAAPRPDVPRLDPCAHLDCGLGECRASAGAPECVCDPGSQLQAGRCVDLCQTVNCGPQGHCEAGACVCAPGAEVDAQGRCVDPVDPCAGYDCGPLGRCQVEAGAAACQCEAGAALIGGRCVDPCLGVDCGLGACRVEGEGYACDCQPGATHDGARCVDLCVGVDCGGGDCVEGACHCHEGFALQAGVCVDPCAGADCAPGDCVVRGEGRPECACPPSYRVEGLTCVHPCDLIDCDVAGAECRLIDDQPACVCPEGQAPIDGACATPDPCAGITCDGHGVCAVVNGQARCECEPGYTANGAHCVEDNNPCQGQACSGQGECLDREGTPVCACNPGFTPSSRAGLDCVPTREVCRGGPIDYDVDGDGVNEEWFEPADDECEMYELVNLTRATHDHEGQPECFTPLNYDVLWSAHARNHSMLMRDQGGLFHADFPGGQNCASPSSPSRSMQMYMTGPSEPHCPDLSHHCNIMRCRFSAIGIGYVDRWNTQNFY